MGKINLYAKNVTINDEIFFVMECYKEAHKSAGFSDASAMDECLVLPEPQDKGRLDNELRKFFSRKNSHNSYEFIILPAKQLDLIEATDRFYNLYVNSWENRS